MRKVFEKLAILMAIVLLNIEGNIQEFITPIFAGHNSIYSSRTLPNKKT